MTTTLAAAGAIWVRIYKVLCFSYTDPISPPVFPCPSPVPSFVSRTRRRHSYATSMDFFSHGAQMNFAPSSYPFDGFGGSLPQQTVLPDRYFAAFPYAQMDPTTGTASQIPTTEFGYTHNYVSPLPTRTHPSKHPHPSTPGSDVHRLSATPGKSKFFCFRCPHADVFQLRLHPDLVLPLPLRPPHPAPPRAVVLALRAVKLAHVGPRKMSVLTPYNLSVVTGRKNVAAVVVL